MPKFYMYYWLPPLEITIHNMKPRASTTYNCANFIKYAILSIEFMQCNVVQSIRVVPTSACLVADPLAIENEHCAQNSHPQQRHSVTILQHVIGTIDSRGGRRVARTRCLDAVWADRTIVQRLNRTEVVSQMFAGTITVDSAEYC